MGDIYWAVAPAKRFGWDWAVSDQPTEEIVEDYPLWHVRWGNHWGWSLTRWTAERHCKAAAKRMRRAEARRAASKITGVVITGVVTDDELEREFERLKKELKRRQTGR